MRVTDEDIRRLIRDVPDFPQPGIIFKDITPLLADKVMFKGVVETVCSHWTPSKREASSRAAPSPWAWGPGSCPYASRANCPGRR
jgi:hypothetical protein